MHVQCQFWLIQKSAYSILLAYLTINFSDYMISEYCGGPGASGRVLPPVIGRSRVRVAVFSHCTGEGKACHWHPSPDPAQSGSSLHWVRPLSTVGSDWPLYCAALGLYNIGYTSNGRYMLVGGRKSHFAMMDMLHMDLIKKFEVSSFLLLKHFRPHGFTPLTLVYASF